jgi:hypothetical protein
MGNSIWLPQSHLCKRTPFPYLVGELHANGSPKFDTFTDYLDESYIEIVPILRSHLIYTGRYPSMSIACKKSAAHSNFVVYIQLECHSYFLRVSQVVV